MARKKNGKFVAKAGKKKHGKKVGARSHNKGGHASGHTGGRKHGRKIGHRAAMAGLGKFQALGLPLGIGAGVALTQVGVGYAVNYAVDKLPFEQIKSVGGKYLVRGALSVAGGFAARKFAPANLRVPILIGLASGFFVDTLVTWVIPHLPIPQGSMHGYETTEQTLQKLEDVSPGTLQGLLAIDRGEGASMGNLPLDIAA